jgi:endonuclease G
MLATVADAGPLDLEFHGAEVLRVAKTPLPHEHFKGRRGFNSRFLSTSDASKAVALPIVDRSDDILNVEAPRRNGILDYVHFSVCMSRSRRMCFYSACNINGKTTRALPRHDTWYRDGRVERDSQLVDSGLFGNQTDRRFARGHQTRRQDILWGPWPEAEQANIDSFTATNSVPQVQSFNGGLWGDLEDHILANATDDSKRISVITGPIFEGDDPDAAELTGQAEYQGILIPRRFFKVVAFTSEVSKKLAAIAFEMSQNTALEKLQAGVSADLGDFQGAQRTVSYIETASGLDFGSLRDADVLAGASPLGTIVELSSVRSVFLPG